MVVVARPAGLSVRGFGSPENPLETLGRDLTDWDHSNPNPMKSESLVCSSVSYRAVNTLTLVYVAPNPTILKNREPAVPKMELDVGISSATPLAPTRQTTSTISP